MHYANRPKESVFRPIYKSLDTQVSRTTVVDVPAAVTDTRSRANLDNNKNYQSAELQKKQVGSTHQLTRRWLFLEKLTAMVMEKESE